MARDSNYPEILATRISTAADDKIGNVARRLGVERAQVVRWWLDEMPEEYVPARFQVKSEKSTKGKATR